MKLVSEAVIKWQVERLSSMILRLRQWVKRSEGSDPALIKQHLGLAEEHFSDAIAALKYNKHQQAFLACEKGFAQVGMAQLLTTYGAQIDATVSSASKIDKATRRKKEGNEFISYLASSLAEMKLAIEYSNFKVSLRAQGFLDSAMDFYNDALSALKQANLDAAKCKAQAGLLQLNLAGQIISAENEMSLPGWRGLTNPALGAPLRRVDDLLENIVACRETLQKLPDDAMSIARSGYEKALANYNAAIHSFSNGSNVHAQALMRTAAEEIEEALATAGSLLANLENGRHEGMMETSDREPLCDVAATISSITALVESLGLSRKDSLSHRLGRVQTLYKEAIRAARKKKHAEAEKLTLDALVEVDLLRQCVLSQVNK